MKTKYQIFTECFEKSILITPLLEGQGGGRL
jgi:hypothetical protein